MFCIFVRFTIDDAVRDDFSRVFRFSTSTGDCRADENGLNEGCLYSEMIGYTSLFGAGYCLAVVVLQTVRE